MKSEKVKVKKWAGRRAFLRWGMAASVALVGVLLSPALRAWEIGEGPRYRTVFRATSEFNGDVKVVEDGFTRYLMFGRSLQTGQDKKNPNRSAFRYVDGFHLGMVAVPQARSALFIGLGGGMGPRQFHNFYPKMRIETVEIDPVVAKIAQDYFKLPVDSRLKVAVGDGRAYLEKSKSKYDLIFLDAYDAHSAPPLLTTVEFMRIIKRHLNPGGALVANVIAAQKGSRSRFGRSEFKTFRAVFSDAQVFPIQSALEAEQADTDYENLMMLAKNGGELPGRAAWSRRVKAIRRPEIRELVKVADRGPLAAWPTGDVETLTDAKPPKEDLFGQ